MHVSTIAKGILYNTALTWQRIAQHLQLQEVSLGRTRNPGAPKMSTRANRT